MFEFRTNDFVRSQLYHPTPPICSFLNDTTHLLHFRNSPVRGSDDKLALMGVVDKATQATARVTCIIQQAIVVTAVMYIARRRGRDTGGITRRKSLSLRVGKFLLKGTKSYAEIHSL
jgi:hypothetical protein